MAGLVRTGVDQRPSQARSPLASALPRAILVVLFTAGVVRHILDPSPLLRALKDGLGMGQGAAAIVAVASVAALVATSLLTALAPHRLALAAASAFLLSGAVYAAMLYLRGYAGGCGCGTGVRLLGINPLALRAAQNLLLAFACLLVMIVHHPHKEYFS